MGLKLYPEESVQAIASAIRDKNGSSDTYTIGQMSQAIEDIPTGGGGSDDNDVIFIDYDGTITNSYTAQEFLALSTMPENPSHERLTAQGWNWSLADAKDYVEDYGELIIGQMYTTKSGATEIDIEFGGDGLECQLGFAVNGSATVDWGDGSTTDTVTGSSASTAVHTSHTYSSSGEFTIKIAAVGNSTVTFIGNNDNGGILINNGVNLSFINKIYFGNNTNVGQYGFKNCYSLKEVTFNNDLVASNYAFTKCYNLKSIVLNSKNFISSTSIFEECYSLEMVSLTKSSSSTSVTNSIFKNCRLLKKIFIPDGIKILGSSCFSNCSALERVIIPSSVNTVNDSVFYACYRLKEVVLPNSVRDIGSSCFSNCSALERVILPNGISIINSNLFYYDYNLKELVIPNSVTLIKGQSFQNCTSIKTIIIPDSVTSIEQSAFNSCMGLTSLLIPDSVTSIGASMFANCHSLGYLKFEGLTPPTVGLNAFRSIRPDCKIYVPTGSLSAYTSASNYPDPNTYTYAEYTPN